MKHFLQFTVESAATLAIGISLSACAGTPAPCTEPSAPIAKVESQETSGNSQVATSSPTVSADTTKPTLPQQTPVKDSIPQKVSSPIQETATAPAIPAGQVTPIAQPSVQTQVQEDTSFEETAIDPYIAFPAMASAVFEHADTLYRQDSVDAAVDYLKRFRVIKPLWEQWEAKADSMLNEFGKTNAERAKQYEPFVLQIQNMNRAHSSYSLVASVADSLISLAPGDSLEQFAQQQKSIARNNTLAKARDEQAAILKLANDQARFAEAEQKALEFQMRYRDFEDDLKIQSMIDNIHATASSVDSVATAYWQKNDPNAALAQARELMDKSKYADAKALLINLRASSLRKEAMDMYQELADAFCNAERKATSQLFVKSQKQKDAAKKQALLNEAISHLDRCLEEYPETSLKQKVLDNRSFLQKELNP